VCGSINAVFTGAGLSGGAMSAGPESRGGAFFGLIAAMGGSGAGVTAADVGCLPKSAQPPNGVSRNSARKIGPNARAARGIDRDSELCIVMGVVPPDIACLFLERRVVLRRVSYAGSHGAKSRRIVRKMPQPTLCSRPPDPRLECEWARFAPESIRYPD
jgi:hypothetical protein